MKEHSAVIYSDDHGKSTIPTLHMYYTYPGGHGLPYLPLHIYYTYSGGHGLPYLPLHIYFGDHGLPYLPLHIFSGGRSYLRAEMF